VLISHPVDHAPRRMPNDVPHAASSPAGSAGCCGRSTIVTRLRGVDDPDFRRLMAFVGYGHLAAPIWFLGMEEGFHKQQNMLRGLTARVRRFTLPTIGLAEGQRLLGLPLDARGRLLSQVWTFMARIVLSSCGDARSSERAQIKHYVLHEMGAAAGITLLAELLPLPRPGIGAWPAEYARWYSDPSAYEADVRPRRTEMFRRLLEEHQPRAVIAYGRANWGHYKEVVGPGVRWEDVAGSSRHMQVARSSGGCTVLLLPFLGQGQFTVRDANLAGDIVRRARAEPK
jgi:hypothetical protein